MKPLSRQVSRLAAVCLMSRDFTGQVLARLIEPETLFTELAYVALISLWSPRFFTQQLMQTKN